MTASSNSINIRSTPWEDRLFGATRMYFGSCLIVYMKADYLNGCDMYDWDYDEAERELQFQYSSLESAKKAAENYIESCVGNKCNTK